MKLCSKCKNPVSNEKKEVCKKCAIKAAKARHRKKRHKKYKMAPFNRHKKAIKNFLVKKYGPYCFYCGEKLVDNKEDQPNQMTIDHFIPLSKGGTHNKSNLRLACKICNGRKKDDVIKDEQTNTDDKK